MAVRLTDMFELSGVKLLFILNSFLQKIIICCITVNYNGIPCTQLYVCKLMDGCYGDVATLCWCSRVVCVYGGKPYFEKK